MKKKYNIEKIKKEGFTKLNSLNDLKDLVTSLNATIETGDGFTSYTLDSKDLKVVHTDLSKLKHISKNLKCPEASKGCKPHGWPKGNSKWK